MWEYKHEESTFEVLPEGDYRIRIKKAEKMVAKSGKDMLALQFEVSGKKNILFHYIVFLPDRPEITNRSLTSLFNAFKDIKEGDFTLANWVGKVGACRVKHEEYNGEKKASIHYFIRADKQGDLPAWVEPPKSDDAAGGSPTPTSNDWVNVSDAVDLPFN